GVARVVDGNRIGFGDPGGRPLHDSSGDTCASRITGDLLRIAPHPLIYDWNHDAAGPRPVAMLDDETLRDGLQSPSVRTPSIEEKIDILHHMDGLGIDTADIGLPGAGPRVARDVERLARAIVESKLKIRANCAARTMIDDIKPIADIQQRTGVPI